MLERLTTLLFRRKPKPTLGEAAIQTLDETVDASMDAIGDALAPRTQGKTVAAQTAARLTMAPVAPALLIAGAGVAFWYWTQWARGQAESAAAEEAKDDQPAA